MKDYVIITSKGIASIEGMIEFLNRGLETYENDYFTFFLVEEEGKAVVKKLDKKTDRLSTYSLDYLYKAYRKELKGRNEPRRSH